MSSIGPLYEKIYAFNKYELHPFNFEHVSLPVRKFRAKFTCDFHISITTCFDHGLGGDKEF